MTRIAEQEARMTQSPALEVTIPSEREVRIVRTFNARRELVFRAWTEPDLVKRWIAGPEGWSVTKSEGDVRAGGNYRIEWSGPDGASMGMDGTYREIDPPTRIVSVESFDEAWYPGDALVTTLFAEDTPEQTTVTMTILYESTTARDTAVASGMTEGMAMTYGSLDRLLTEIG
nr:activator of Hsp90 ATPase 1 family protein [uncultured bacterium]